MTEELLILSLSAFSIGFIHTILGPDHFLPFIVMSKAGKWSQAKTITITLLSGLGHVLSSVLLGFLGIGLGAAITDLTEIESFRGNLAGWFLLAFGFTYTVYGIKKTIQNKPHTHLHIHADESPHAHEHLHSAHHAHIHHKTESNKLTPWILFTIFILGPCEPLIPILMYPAANESLFGLILVTLIFAAATIGTMLTVVILGIRGLDLLPMKKIERYTHLLAGLLVLLSGIAIQFLGL
ncbi:MAG: sulfite exporter TauE/SafE family protein [Bacteroidetes bacterium]|nr:sulfite exporter TauE/SafE family protein [Bacteroidota bacterium]